MPGARTGMEVSSNTPRGSARQPYNDSVALYPTVKDEADRDSGDIFGDDSDDEDGYNYKPRPQLPQPNVNMRSLASLIKELESGVIDVDPEYQREVVWTADRMTGLINSLMENYYIPPIILNKKRNPGLDGSIPRDTLVCVDGKQRLSSVRAFVKGMIPCHDRKGEKWWFCDTPDNKRKKVLPLDTQKLFLAKDFVAFQFTELTPEQEEDLFARVQMGVQLSAAEKMRAKTGPWQELAKLFVADFPAVYDLMNDRTRAKDFQLTMSCFSQIVEVKHPTAANCIPTLKTTHSAISKLQSNTGAVDDALKSHLASVWNTFRELIELDSNTFTNADGHLSGVQTFSPVEMAAVTVLISMYSETRNNALLLGDIRALREALREHFKDLRLHITAWRFVWDFIEDLEAIRGAVDGSTVNQKQLAGGPKSMPSTLRTKALASPSATVSRKRAAPPSLPLSIPSPQNSVVVRDETRPTLAAPKRQRTDSGASNTQASITNPVHGNVGNPPHFAMRPIAVPTTSPLFGNLFAQFGSQQPSPVSATSASPRPWGSGASPNLNAVSNHSPQAGPMQTPSMPPHQVLQRSGNGQENYTLPVSAPAARGAAEQAIPQQQPQTDVRDGGLRGPVSPQSDYLIPNLPKVPPQPYHQSRLPPTQVHATYTPFTPEPTPPQMQQTNASESGSYQAPVAPMQPSRQLYPTAWQNTQYLQNNTTVVSSPPPNMTQTLPTSRGAFSPSHTDAQWEGVIASASPRMPPQQLPQTQPAAPSVASSRTVPPTAPQPNVRKRKSVTRPTPAQCDGAIDLTSDNELEEERQNLLSSFKAKTAPAKEPSATAAPAANAPTSSTRRKPVVIHDLDLDEDYALANNPYERFKTSKVTTNTRAGLSGPKR